MIVLDAAALVDVVVRNPLRTWVLDQVADEEVCAPAHQPSEVLSAVLRWVRAGDLERDEAERALRDAGAFPQELVLPSAGHVARAVAINERVRAADALYVALAEERGCPLVTTDGRLARAGLDCEVRVPQR